MPPRPWKVFGPIAAATLVVWLTWPSGDQVNAENCSPKGVFATLSANVHGKLFWKNQLAGISREREKAENWDQYEADAKATAADADQKAKEFLETFYADNPRFAPSGPQRAAEALRSRADRIEEAESQRFISGFMQKEAAMFARCEAIITAKLTAHN